MRFSFDSYFACLIFAGMGLGTLSLGASPRLVILWTTLLGLWLAYREGQSLRLEYRFADIGRGAGIGLAIGAPLLLLAFRPLATAIPILYVSVKDPSMDGVGGTTIFASLVLLAPLAEELFFRDILHRERGLTVSAVLYAAAGVIFFLPTAGSFPVVLIAVSGASALLGVVYSFLHERYGLATSIACHSTINLFLLFMPAILNHLKLFAQ
jgi:membrane protease YdiL (CAAX protease family)